MSKVFNCELKKVIDDSYDIEIGNNLQSSLLNDITNNKFNLKNINKFAIITDSNVSDLYAKPILELLIKNGLKADLFTFDAGEKSKVRKTKEILEDEMLSKGYRRDCMVISVGGGVVSDLSGFIAGTFGRGVPFVNYATTLLSAADASIGGKVAVDTPLATNLIGLFYQPRKVYIDLSTWSTLPKKEISSGLAETIKHAIMADADFFSYLEDNIEKVFDFESNVCEHIANKNCNIKYNVVMQDERESGLREILNLGHTVGRAIETVSEYKLLHGEALSIGLVAVCKLSEKLGFMSAEEVSRVISLLNKTNLPTTIPDYIKSDDLLTKLYTDKKVRNGNLRFVIPKCIGEITEFSDSYAKIIEEETIKDIILDM